MSPSAPRNMPDEVPGEVTGEVPGEVTDEVSGEVSGEVPGEVPPGRVPGAYAVALVCLGNICRSPIADVVLSDRVARAGLDHQVHVASAGTAGYHVGEAMDERAAATLVAADLDPSQHRARQFEAAWHQRFDLVLAMDQQNLDDLGGRDDEGRVRLFRDFDPATPGGEVPDPYYGEGDGFDQVLDMVGRTVDTLIPLLERAVGGSPDDADAEKEAAAGADADPEGVAS